MAADATDDSMFHAGLRLDILSRDLDDMAQQMLLWGIEMHQLGRGPFESGVSGMHSPRIQLSTGYRRPGVMIRGSVPRGGVTISSVVRKDGPLYFRGSPLGEHDLMLVSGDELDFRSLGYNELVTLSIEERLFREAFQAVFGAEGEAQRLPERLAVKDALGRRRINDRLRALLAEGRAAPERLSQPASAREWEVAVLDALFDNVTLPEGHVNGVARRRAAQQAEAFLRESLHRAVSVTELCLETGVPKRTLMLGFQDTCGMSPIAYHRRLRLNQARRDLLRSSAAEATVAQIALRWGFEHFGRFSADYRRQFGESPGETLRR